MTCQGTSFFGGYFSGSYNICTPQSLKKSMLLKKAGWLSRPDAVSTHGTATTGIFRPIYSHNKPKASVSEIPSAHLLMVLKVAGKTTIASALGRTSGSSGRLYSARTG